MKFRRGFTLIELLIVIAIIAILAAILFPVFVSVQKSAIRTRCASDVKQILYGIAQYMQDNGGRVPPGYDPSPSGPYNWQTADFGQTWNERILPYVKNKDIFVCPAVPSALVANGTGYTYFKWRSPLGFPTTYGLNWRLCSGGGGSLYPHSTKSSLISAGLFGVTVAPETVRRPSKVIMICESQNGADRITDKGRYSSIRGGGGVLVYSDTGNYYWLIRGLTNPYLPQGHGGGANFGLVDGHVVFVKFFQPTATGPTGVGTPPSASSVEAAGLAWW